MPIPPINLKIKKEDTSQAIAEPIAPTTNSTPFATKFFFLPYLAAGILPIREPNTVPQRAAEIAVKTVKEYKKKTGSTVKVVFNVFKEADENIYHQLLK